MKKHFVLALFVVCLTVACGTYLPPRIVYLSPPPDVLYDAAVDIIKDMGFVITHNTRVPTGLEKYPNFYAKRKDEASGKIIGVHVDFRRVSSDTLVGITIEQPLGIPATFVEKIRDEIELRLRSAGRRS